MVFAPVRRDNPRALARALSFSEGIIDRTDAKTMLYLTCTMIHNVDLAHYGVSRAKDWVSVDCDTNQIVYNRRQKSISDKWLHLYRQP